MGTKGQAAAEAEKYCNSVAIPLQLFEHLKFMELRVVVAERKLQELGIRIDYDANREPQFISLLSKKES